MSPVLTIFAASEILTTFSIFYRRRYQFQAYKKFSGPTSSSTDSPLKNASPFIRLLPDYPTHEGVAITTLKPLTPHPALLHEEASERTLIIADLHIGWEIGLTAKGIHIPSQTQRIQERLLEIINEHEPTRLVIVGDVKQAVAQISLREWKDVPEFFEAVQESVKDITVTVGNHDGDLEPLTPTSVTILPSSGTAIGKNPRLGIFHGHAWPSPEVLSSDLLVMGHIHPVVRLGDRIGFWTVRKVWIRTKCDGGKLARAYLKYLGVKVKSDPRELFEERFGFPIGDPRLVVMPAFNDLLGGLSVNRIRKRMMGTLLRSGGVDIDGSETYLLDGTYVGTVEQLRTLFG